MKRPIVNLVGLFLSVCAPLLSFRTPLDAAPVKIHIAVSMPTIGTLPVWIAKDRGFFSKEGLEVEIIAVSGGLDITSLISGSVEFSDSVPSGAIVAAQKGTDIKVVAGTLNAITYSVMGRKGLKGLKDLKGKRIGVGGIYSGSTLVLHEMLVSEGLSYPQDYTLLRVGGASDRLASIVAGQVDAATLPLPFNLIAADQGAVKLADASEYVRHYQNTTLLVRGKWAEENPDVVVRFLRGLIDSIKWILNNRDEFAIYAVKKLKMKRDYAVEGWDTYAGKKIWPIDGSPTREGLETVIRRQVRLGFLPDGLKVDRFMDLSYLQKAQRE